MRFKMVHTVTQHGVLCFHKITQFHGTGINVTSFPPRTRYVLACSSFRVTNYQQRYEGPLADSKQGLEGRRCAMFQAAVQVMASVKQTLSQSRPITR
jgi:hypothetical protein